MVDAAIVAAIRADVIALAIEADGTVMIVLDDGKGTAMCAPVAQVVNFCAAAIKKNPRAFFKIKH